MAKAKSTPSPRRREAVPGKRRRHPPISHSRAFVALDGIESALIDAETTMALFASMVDHGTSIDDACISAIERHLASDLAAVRGAFRKAHAETFPDAGDTQ